MRKACVARDIEAFEKKIDVSDTESDEEVDLSSLFDWSREAGSLHELLQKKSNWRLAYVDELYRYFSHLSLRRMGIRHVTEAVERFTSLQELNVSGNQLKSITVLPDSLVTFHAYDNLIAYVDISGNVSRTLVHLGFGYNKLRFLPTCLQRLDALESLDVSYNCLTNLPKLLQTTKGMTKLSHLEVYGNPLCLLANYRDEVEYQLPTLQTLDDVKCGEPRGGTRCLNTREFSLSLTVAQLVVNGIVDPALEAKEDSSNRTNYVQLDVALLDGTTVSTRLAGPIPHPTPPKASKQPEVANSEETELDLNFSHSLHLPITVDIRDKIDLEGLVLSATLVSKQKPDESSESQQDMALQYSFGALEISLRPLLAKECNGQVRGSFLTLSMSDAFIDGDKAG